MTTAISQVKNNLGKIKGRSGNAEEKTSELDVDTANYLNKRDKKEF